MDKKKAENYAKLLVQVGVNVQIGQTVVLQVSSDDLQLAREITKAAFEVGAKDVVVHIEDPVIKRYRALYATLEVLSDVPQWKKDSLDHYLKDDGVSLAMVSTYPNLFEGVDNDKALALGEAENQLRNEIRKYFHSGKLQWNLTVWPNQKWAEAVYPELSPTAAFLQLEEDLCTINRVGSDNNPIKEWAEHCERLKVIADALNKANFKSLHITTGLGTDLYMDLVKDHIWSSAAGNTGTKAKAAYIANMPTEEIATDPDFRSVNGVAVASFPLMLSGKLIKDFSLTFKDGLAVACQAQENEEVLKDILFKDERSRSLGEVALVSKYSPIKLLQRVFYNGLIDENAASHLAFGSSFPDSIKGGNQMSEAELLQHGVNVSPIHVDFMIGTDDMKVVGRDFDGKETVIMEDGDFCL